MTDSSQVLSPKAFAEAIGVSESSVKRWADSGLIEVTKTAGGHRRIMLSDAVRFVRERQMRLVHPENLGLATGSAEVIAKASREPEPGELIEQMKSGRPDHVSTMIVAAFVQGSTVADLWDGPISETLDYFGSNWTNNKSGIPLEHETTMTIVDSLGRIRSLLPDPAETATVALGGSPTDDPYLLPNLAASCVLTEARMRVVNLGPNTPAESFVEASQRHKPDLLWISMTCERSETNTSEIQDLIERVDFVREVVLGGRFALANRYRWGNSVRVLRTMNELALVAEALEPGSTRE